jgi:hypothetical protein
MGKTHSKLLAVRHGGGMAWAWHAMCESALRILFLYDHLKMARLGSLGSFPVPNLVVMFVVRVYQIPGVLFAK